MEMQTRNFIISFAIRDHLHLCSGLNIRHEIPYFTGESSYELIFHFTNLFNFLKHISN